MKTTICFNCIFSRFRQIFGSFATSYANATKFLADASKVPVKADKLINVDALKIQKRRQVQRTKHFPIPSFY